MSNERKENGKTPVWLDMLFELFSEAGYFIVTSMVLGMMVFGGGLFLFNFSFMTTGLLVLGVFVVGAILYMISDAM